MAENVKESEQLDKIEAYLEALSTTLPQATFARLQIRLKGIEEHYYYKRQGEHD